MKPLLIAILLFILGIGLLIISQQNHRNTAYQDGINAAKAGLPPECNPYKDYQGTAWLEGYVKGKQ